jgi:type I restriction enzyme, S subunit
MQTDAFNEHSVKQSRGSVNPYVNFSDLAWYEFPLPPKDEQRRIAELLWAADEVEQKRVALVKTLNQLHGSTSLELFHEAATMSDIVRCEGACIEITVGIVVTPAKYYVSKGVPALRSLNVFPNRFVLDDLVEISHEAHLSFSKSRVSQGDVVVVRTGRPGDSAVIPEALDNSNCIDLLIARPKPILRSWYLCHYLNSVAGRRQLSRGIAGTAQQHFNVGELKKLQIPIPPLSEQDRIIDILGTLNDRRAHVESQIRRDAQMKTQLRDHLLAGRSVEHVH